MSDAVQQPLKARIAAGDQLLGTWVKTPSPMVCEVLGATALDMVCLDAEHAPFDRLVQDQCLHALNAAQMPALVRVPSASSEYTVAMGDTDWYLRGLYKFTGSRANDLVANADIGGIGLFDVFTGLRSENWELSLWAKNVFDKEARTRIRQEEAVPVVEISRDPVTNAIQRGRTSIPSGYRRVSVVPERVIGLTAKYDF